MEKEKKVEVLKKILASGNKMPCDQLVAEGIQIGAKNKLGVFGIFVVSGYCDVERDKDGKAVAVSVSERGMSFIEGKPLPPRRRMAPQKVDYIDYANVLPELKKAYESKQFVLMIGEKGTGKTTAVMKLAQELNMPLFQINCSLRTREHNFIGRWEIRKGETKFIEGVLPKSMRAGGLLYIDEINQAEPDVLIRLAEATDDRRQLTFDGKVVRANRNWFVIATINPLKYMGTKELPPQILSRLPVRVYFKYPDAREEERIVNKHVKGADAEVVKKIVMVGQKLRGTDLQYVPSIRETISAVKLIMAGTEMQQAIEMTMINSLWQFGKEEVRKATELIVSLGVISWKEKF